MCMNVSKRASAHGQMTTIRRRAGRKVVVLVEREADRAQCGGCDNRGEGLVGFVADTDEGSWPKQRSLSRGSQVSVRSSPSQERSGNAADITQFPALRQKSFLMVSRVCELQPVAVSFMRVWCVRACFNLILRDS